jgi:uncharacterized membrane protein (DUF2068 family)
VAGQRGSSDQKNPRMRSRLSLALAAAALGLEVAIEGVALATSSPTPVLRSLSLGPGSIPASGGVVHIKVSATRATSCVIASSPGIKGLPKAVSCKTGVASLSLHVPSNGYAVTRRFHVSARAVHLQVSSPTSYRWLAQAATPRVMTCTGSLVVKPAYYVIFCGDGNGWWQKVRWTNWGAKSAIGTGQYVENDCIPYCAVGHFRTYPATILLSRLTSTKKYGPLYVRATVSYVVNGRRRAYTVPVPT